MSITKDKMIKKVLRFFAVKILEKYKPRVIGVTGSVGKSTAKEMITTVLKEDFSVRKSEKNYNNEVGIPLAIIGASGEKKNLLQWAVVIMNASKLVLLPSRYPEILVLELASDGPGDIKYFCDFIPVEVGVLTNVGISHLENFGTKEAIFKEKYYLLQQASGSVMYNKDSISDEQIGDEIIDNIISYGFDGDADFAVAEIGYNYDKKGVLAGMIFDIAHDNKNISGRLNNLIGYPYLYGAIAALSVAKYFNIELLSAMQRLEGIPAIAGRMSLLEGIKNTRIIDDTYNSAPASVNAALSVMKELKASRKIIVLGDMLELGQEELISHQSIGMELATMKNTIFIAVGSRMKLAVDAFREAGGTGDVHWFKKTEEVGVFIQNLLKQGDIVLVKGSQGMRMERLVLEIMTKPNDKKELLVRQTKDWQ